MRYRLKTLLIVLAVGPPLLGMAWVIGKPIVASYFARQQDDVWIDVAGPGTIKEFSTHCTFQEDDQSASRLP